VLVLLAERHGLLELGTGCGGLFGKPILVAAIAGDAGNDQDGDGNDENAIAVPQSFELLAADFLINFLKDIGHERRLPSSSCR
jgi:hypothetical protein